jgi:hypothetical protein
MLTLLFRRHILFFHACRPLVALPAVACRRPMSATIRLRDICRHTQHDVITPLMVYIVASRYFPDILRNRFSDMIPEMRQQRQPSRPLPRRYLYHER